MMVTDARAPGWLGRWGPVAAVVVAIAVLTLGGRVAADLVGGTSPVTVGVDGVATITPPGGWAVEDPSGTPTDGSRRFVLTKGGAVVAFTAIDGALVAAPELASRYRLALEDRFVQLAWTRPVAVTVGGVPGVRFAYGGLGSSGTAVEGVVAVAVSPSGEGLIIDGVASEGSLAAVAGDLATMAEGARIG
jgi:hypothetical protein